MGNPDPLLSWSSVVPEVSVITTLKDDTEVFEGKLEENEKNLKQVNMKLHSYRHIKSRPE